MIRTLTFTNVFFTKYNGVCKLKFITTLNIHTANIAFQAALMESLVADFFIERLLA